MGRLIRIATITALLSLTGVSQAGMFCVDQLSSSAVANSGCQLVSSENFFLHPVQVSDQMDDFNHWAHALERIRLGEALEIRLILTRDTLSDNPDTDDIWSLFSDVYIVFRGEDGNEGTRTYSRFSLLPGMVSGTYLTPVENMYNGDLRELSYISFYNTNSTQEISEPGILLLLGFGLVSLALARRHTS